VKIQGRQHLSGSLDSFFPSVRRCLDTRLLLNRLYQPMGGRCVCRYHAVPRQRCYQGCCWTQSTFEQEQIIIISCRLRSHLRQTTQSLFIISLGHCPHVRWPIAFLLVIAERGIVPSLITPGITVGADKSNLISFSPPFPSHLPWGY
jgi:hypothetical protein